MPTATAFASELVAGYVPYHAAVEAITIDAEKSTVVDQRGVPGYNGLRTGIYQDETRFRIESRDDWSNRVFHGPVREVQIIETTSDDAMAGSFTISFGGHDVDVDVMAGIDIMKSRLESLPNIGRVHVDTRSVTTETHLYADVEQGSNKLQFPNGSGANVAAAFAVGDWIRIHDDFVHKNETYHAYGPVFTVTDVDSTNAVVTISSAYPDIARERATVYNNGGLHKYQYIVTFDSNLGDLPALKATKAFTGTNSEITVTSCDLLTYQVVSSRCTGTCTLSGTFYLQMGGRRRMLPSDVARRRSRRMAAMAQGTA